MSHLKYVIIFYYVHWKSSFSMSLSSGRKLRHKTISKAHGHHHRCKWQKSPLTRPPTRGNPKAPWVNFPRLRCKANFALATAGDAEGSLILLPMHNSLSPSPSCRRHHTIRPTIRRDAFRPPLLLRPTSSLGTFSPFPFDPLSWSALGTAITELARPQES